MGNSSQSIQKINFEDIQYVLKNLNTYLLINTLSISEQNCLIPNTVNIDKEEDLINKLIETGNKSIKIIIYGKNSNDEKIYKKYTQLNSLGFYNIYLYSGGLFEWLLLQDIYGNKEFPTTTNELDILKYKSNKILGIPLLEFIS
jgi:23S rRNA pseudoU1915 N3-methylase RlmH